MTHDLTVILTCALLALAQLAIIAAGLAFMLNFRPAARRMSLAGLGLIVAAAIIPALLPALPGLVHSLALPLLLLAVAGVVALVLPFRAIVRSVYGTSAKANLPSRFANPTSSSKTFPGYRDR